MKWLQNHGSKCQKERKQMAKSRMWYLGILTETFYEIASKAKEVRCEVG
jgi:hypothetical protein